MLLFSPDFLLYIFGGLYSSIIRKGYLKSKSIICLGEKLHIYIILSYLRGIKGHVNEDF